MAELGLFVLSRKLSPVPFLEDVKSQNSIDVEVWERDRGIPTSSVSVIDQSFPLTGIRLKKPQYN